MRIVGIGSFMNTAGAQAALVRVMENLRARGHETETWFFYEEQKAFQDRASVYSFYQKPKLSIGEYAALPGKVFGRLAQAKPDAVVTFLPLACVLGQSAALMMGVKRRVASQRTPAWSHNAPMRIADRILGASPAYTDNICVSKAVLEGFGKYPASYRRKLAVVHNGLDWAGSPLSREAARAQFGLPPDQIIAIATGRLKNQKNFAFMLEAMAYAPSVHLLIAGEGPLREALEAQRAALGLQDRVRFLGPLPPGEVATLLRAADLFVQTSTYEGQSNSTLEAMHEGLPIICSDIEMQRETLHDGKTAAAILLPLGDAALWGREISRLAADPAARAALGASARSHVESRFSLNAMIDGFERVICS